MKVDEVTPEYLTDLVFKDCMAVDRLANQLSALAANSARINKHDPIVSTYMDKSALAHAAHQAYKFLVEGVATRPDPMNPSQKTMFALVEEKLKGGVFDVSKPIE